ncbi:unnamed protein product [Phytomonas sp. Hart1]|nr:unnamed protein product [Phytomonas sp. Hart1]|eukprot:CCW67553.1 unnamed protein product [Phytomonas sp. isolate Hart1]
MATVLGGSVLGHGISNYLYGQSNQAPQQPVKTAALVES